MKGVSERKPGVVITCKTHETVLNTSLGKEGAFCVCYGELELKPGRAVK